MKQKLTSYIQHFAPTAAEQHLFPLAIEYYARAELYDRTVCTGPVTDGDGVLPANHAQIGLINRNAAIIYRELLSRAHALGYNNQDFNEARKMISKLPISQILNIYYLQLDEARIAALNSKRTTHNETPSD